MSKEAPLVNPLVPALLDQSIDPHFIQELKNLPHLQRVAGLVFLLLSAKGRIFKEDMEELAPKAEEEELPDLLTGKLVGLGLPFGFDEVLTRAILESANEIYENQRMVEASEGYRPTDEEGTPLLPVDFLDETLSLMLFDPLSNPFFPEIFPPEAARQLKGYLKGGRDIARS